MRIIPIRGIVQKPHSNDARCGQHHSGCYGQYQYYLHLVQQKVHWAEAVLANFRDIKCTRISRTIHKFADDFIIMNIYYCVILLLL